MANYSYSQWVYDICCETFHLGPPEMQLLYDVTNVSCCESAVKRIGISRESARTQTQCALFTVLQVPFNIICPHSIEHLGKELERDNTDGTCYRYHVGPPGVGGVPVSPSVLEVVIVFNGRDHFTPTIPMGE